MIADQFRLLNIIYLPWWSLPIRLKVVQPREKHSKSSTRSRERSNSTTSVWEERLVKWRAKDLPIGKAKKINICLTCSPSSSSFLMSTKRHFLKLNKFRSMFSIRAHMDSSIWKTNVSIYQNLRIISSRNMSQTSIMFLQILKLLWSFLIREIPRPVLTKNSELNANKTRFKLFQFWLKLTLYRRITSKRVRSMPKNIAKCLRLSAVILKEDNKALQIWWLPWNTPKEDIYSLRVKN